MELLHTYSDNSKLYKMSAKSLIMIPIWKGNRIIDEKHVNNIKYLIGNNINLLDSGYKIIKYNEEDEDGKKIKKSYLIDGQHRRSVVSEIFENNPDIPDFIVTVTEKSLESELEAIEYFRNINNVKPICFEEDPNLVINRYISDLINYFPKKNKLIRNGSTKRPYLSVDKLREKLQKNYEKIKIINSKEFINKCIDYNNKLLRDLEIYSLHNYEKDSKMIQKILELNFALAWDEKLKWIDEIF
jgi:hypothetical protein